MLYYAFLQGKVMFREGGGGNCRYSVFLRLFISDFAAPVTDSGQNVN
jgi:hypothetical protein